MIISNKGLELIKNFEGCRLKAYKDAVGIWTIGYGHTKNVKEGLEISKEEAELLLKSDIATFENAVNKKCEHLNLTQCEFDALVSFTFNCGSANLTKLIKNRTKTQIADALLLYNKAGGKELAGLTKRRKAERDLYLSVPIVVVNDKDITHIVVKGDTLWSIAKKYLGAGCKYMKLMDYNKLPNTIIRVGQTIKIPMEE